jgi:hypothetical protein
MKQKVLKLRFWVSIFAKTMNKTLTRIFCLLMAFQVLFASTGFAMYEHFCKIKGSTSYSLSAPKKSCCSVKKPSTETSKKSVLKRAKCCSDQVSLYKISPNASQSIKIDFKTPSLAWVHTPIFTYAYTQTSEKISFNTLHYSNSAPQLSGRDRLVFIQSFLI